VIVSAHPIPGVRPALAFDVGYRDVCWFNVFEAGMQPDRDVSPQMREFLYRVAALAHDLNLDEQHGVAYLRVIDAGEPENYMVEHVDNEHGGVRFTTAVATDDYPVNMVFGDEQPPNGHLVMFTTEPHRVRKQYPRPGEKTVVFFATLNSSREAADLVTTNNTGTGIHAVLGQLRESR
jgi:hypothetical protein